MDTPIYYFACKDQKKFYIDTQEPYEPQLRTIKQDQWNFGHMLQ